MAQPVPTHVLHDVVFDLDVEFQLVAAERVVTLGLAVGVRHGMTVARTLAVVDYDFLVQVVNHQENISFTFPRPAASASISAAVL